MNTMQSMTKGLVILLAGVFLQGCAAAPKDTTTGFLQGNPQFQAGPSDGIDQVYTKPGMDLKKYKRVMLDEAKFFLKKDAASQGLQASELKELSDTFHKAVFEAMGTAYPLVSEPGNDVLRVRLAITDVETSNPAMNGVTTVLPIDQRLPTPSPLPRLTSPRSPPVAPTWPPTRAVCCSFVEQRLVRRGLVLLDAHGHQVAWAVRAAAAVARG